MSPPAAAEGVIKFSLEFSPAPPPEWTLLEHLEAWRRVLFRLGLVGQNPERYDGLAYGNVSLRHGNSGFFISGTQTGALERLAADHYSKVTAYEVADNRLWAEGSIRPSSEALTHAAAYRSREAIGCVLHVHSPEVWQAANAIGIPAISPDIPYGTPAMALAVESLLAIPRVRLIAMAGHEDGLLAVGESVEQAALALVEALAEALRKS